MEITKTTLNKINYECPFQKETANSNIKPENLELKDFNCNIGTNSINFTFISCCYCKNKIFFEKNKDNLPMNGMIGINIKCPYSSCGKYFYLTICTKCKEYKKIPKIIKEGEIIKCSGKKNCECGNEYIQIKCPIKYCLEMTYLPKPKNYCNFPNGIIYNHKKELIYQKISCNYCFRPIVYISKKNDINRYYDSMLIKCPYDNCRKEFNRIVCSICSEINIIEKGFYFMGHRIKCSWCKNYFGKILCPKCLKVNPLQRSFFLSGEMTCRYTLCSQKSNIINCLHCRRMNIFNDKPPIQGQKIICAYNDCGKPFSEVYCPSCGELNPFPEGDFIFGKAYKCLYCFCQKVYQFLICPNCSTFSRTLDPQEGKKYNCNNCKALLTNWGCPFCKKTVMDKNSSLHYGQIVRCPDQKCQKEYSFIRCFSCQKLIFSEESKIILGLSVKCKECKNVSVNIICPICTTKICIVDRMNDMVVGEKIKCTNCEKEFEYNNNMIKEDIYSDNLSILGEIKGDIIEFGKNCVDENYLLIEKSLINSDSYKQESNDNQKKEEKNNMCIICHSNIKESVFYPCGHRWTCYNCAVYFFNMFKKCPRCDKVATCIIPRIYEQFNYSEK